jgi:hypothetical protein
MACEICGRNNCTRSFHPLGEQSSFDDIADEVKDRMRAVLKDRISRLKDFGQDTDKYLVDVSDVISIIDDY